MKFRIDLHISQMAMIVAVSALTASLASSVYAQELPDFGFVWDASSDSMDAIEIDPLDFGEGNDNGDGTFGFVGEFQGPVQLYTLEWDITVKPDPFIIANTVVTNNSMNTETFSLTMNLPVDALEAPTLINGSITGSVTDNGGGATVAALEDDSIYTALIDGSSVQTLLDDPFSQSAGAFESETVGPAEFGPQNGPAVSESIGITLTFELSPGDSASFTSIFNVVPTPGALALFGFAGIFARRRRR